MAGLMACAPTASHPNTAESTTSDAVPEPAIPAVLSAFDRHEVVALPAGHGMKDIDDFILALVRDPRFPDKVNDIAVECGNSLYQPVLDQYVAGMDVPFTEVRKVWRNTTQSMCGWSAFYEQLFPLVRAINQRLPPDKRLRMLAGDPPIDWDQVETTDDVWRYFKRDETIASVMEKRPRRPFGASIRSVEPGQRRDRRTARQGRVHAVGTPAEPPRPPGPMETPGF